MGNNQTYKNRALSSLEGKWANGIIATLIVFIISGGIGHVASTPFDQATGLSVSGFWTLICLPLSWGNTVYFLNLARGLDINYERLFDGYKDFIRIFLAQFLISVCVFVGCLFFIIPGIILGLMFSQTAYILKDDPDISAADAMKKSVSMMQGHKMQLFWLALSFIGWILLCLLTFGLGFLILCPYMETAMAHYYEDLKAESRE